MSDNKKKILEMLEKQKISADEAYRLLRAVDSNEKVSEDTGCGSSSSKGPSVKGKSQYLRVTITPGENQSEHGRPERVNVRVPMSLLRTGIKLTSLIPPEAMDKTNQALHEKGINFDVRNLKTEDIEALIEALGDTEIDIEGTRGEKIKVFVE
jgi:SHOCT-like domain